MPIRYATVHHKAGRKKTNFLTPTKIQNWAKITKISPKNSLSKSGVKIWPANQSIIPLDLDGMSSLCINKSFNVNWQHSEFTVVQKPCKI